LQIIETTKINEETFQTIDKKKSDSRNSLLGKLVHSKEAASIVYRKQSKDRAREKR